MLRLVRFAPFHAERAALALSLWHPAHAQHERADIVDQEVYDATYGQGYGSPTYTKRGCC